MLRDEDCIEAFKQLESYINDQILKNLNNEHFVSMIACTLDSHLTEVEEVRSLVQKWFELLDVPSKDDIALLSLNIIQKEKKLDEMEDGLYQLKQNFKGYKGKLEKYKSVLMDVERELKSNDNCNTRLAEIKNIKNEIDKLWGTF